MEQKEEIKVLVAGPEHEAYVDTILQTIADAAKVDDSRRRQGQGDRYCQENTRIPGH